MSSIPQFRFRFESLIKKYRREKRIAELALAKCRAEVERTNTEIVKWQQTNQRLAETWNNSLQTATASIIESRLVFARQRQTLDALQNQLQAGQLEVEQARAALTAISQRLHSIESIREKDLELFKSEVKRKSERDVLAMILRKQSGTRVSNERGQGDTK